MDKPTVKYLKDYRPPEYLIEGVELHVNLKEEQTVVTSTLSVKRGPGFPDGGAPLVLNGEKMELVSIALDKRTLSEDLFRLDAETLTVLDPPASFELETVNIIHPQENEALEGLFKSGAIFCTQCEAEGFRRITWYPDRPDVMAPYTCTIEADKTKYPVLLSNGNPVDSGDLPGGRHWITWKDPFKKPCYLFALVAGNLFCFEDTFTTRSGRDIALRIYVEHENRDKCAHAMESLKKAMHWDEQVFGLEYDLSIYMIVAVNDFNMGAMENKGLNIFNSKYVLAKPETASDNDFWNIERVIAHEYFHNWTGNRVTLRDWFQLSLKEGLTVFRDQEFAADQHSRPVKRIGDVRVLRAAQFPEDSGPMAHPVRPASYIKMDNFYTVTVYEKGAEVIRLIHTFLGAAGFRKGMDLYFERHDGQAVTIEDFVSAMEDANGADLQQLMLWYSQAGTPRIEVERAHDAGTRSYTLTFRQHCPPTPDMQDKHPMPIPVAVGLIDSHGGEIPLRLEGEDETDGSATRILELKAEQETFRFLDVPAEPVPSLLRGFSAPVLLDAGLSDEEQAFLFAHDTDEFCRWDAGQKLFSRVVLRMAAEIGAGASPTLDESLVKPVRKTLRNRELDKMFIAQALSPPTEQELAILMSEQGPIDPEALHAARHTLTSGLAERLRADFEAIFEENRDDGPYTIDPVAVGRRSLKNLALSYLGKLELPDVTRFVFDQFNGASNMTDSIAALSVLTHIEGEERRLALEDFYERWQTDTLVLDKWFTIQAMAQLPDTQKRVEELLVHPAFSMKNPNKVRSLIGVFGSSNHWCFHAASGEGYAFMADRVLELDAINPQVAARIVSLFNQWKKYEPKRKALMEAQLEKIHASTALSKNVFEIVSKSLA